MSDLETFIGQEIEEKFIHKLRETPPNLLQEYTNIEYSIIGECRETLIDTELEDKDDIIIFCVRFCFDHLWKMNTVDYYLTHKGNIVIIDKSKKKSKFIQNSHNFIIPIEYIKYIDLCNSTFTQKTIKINGCNRNYKQNMIQIKVNYDSPNKIKNPYQIFNNPEIIANIKKYWKIKPTYPSNS